jgi:hypothetical protein
MWTSSSQVERRQSLPRFACRLWAGLACGMLAAAVNLVWFALHSLMRGEFWWSKFNVAAGWFYEMEVYHAGLSWVTLCGASVIVLFYCLAGACYAWGWEALFRKRAFLATALYVTAVYIVAAYFVWPSFNPFARLWFPWTATLPAHVALFAMLARYPEFYIRLVNDFGDPAWLQQKHPQPLAEFVEKQPPKASFEAPGEASSSAESEKD